MMHTVKWVVWVLSFLIATLPGALWAQSPTGTGGNSSYAVLKGGSFFPDSSDMDKQNASNGFAGRVGFGYYLNRYFSLEADLGYQEFKGSKDNIERKYQLFPLEVSGKLGLPLSFVEPYLTVGVGGYYVKAKAGNLEETSTRAGFFGGGGVNFNLGHTIFIGVEARYLVLSTTAPTPTPYSTSGTGNVNLDGVMVTGNLGFRF
jgi:opacity protein-like surface antigen